MHDQIHQQPEQNSFERLRHKGNVHRRIDQRDCGFALLFAAARSEGRLDLPDRVLYI